MDEVRGMIPMHGSKPCMRAPPAFVLSSIGGLLRMRIASASSL